MLVAMPGSTLPVRFVEGRSALARLAEGRYPGGSAAILL
jgi:hypothetical protein